MAHWVGESKSNNCIWCVRHGDYALSDFIHTLHTCSFAQAVSQYIRKNFTNLKEITPVSVILTNNRCTKLVDKKWITHKKLPNSPQFAQYMKKALIDTQPLTIYSH